MKSGIMRRIIALTVCTAMLLMNVPTAWAGERDQDLSAADGAYVPGEVIVLFEEDAVRDKDISIKAARALPETGTDFGMSLNATGDADEAADSAKSEIEILKESLGDDFVLEDSLVFPEVEDDEDGNGSGGMTLGSEDMSDGRGELDIALISSDKYDTETLIEKLSHCSGVAAAEPNYYIYDQEYEDYALDDTYSSYLYQANSPLAENTAGDDVDGRGEMPDDPEDSVSVKAANAWKKLEGSDQEVVVAVIDTGINPEHEDLASMLWTNPGNIGLKGKHGYNFGDDNTDIMDHNGHGTHCCGIIAAEANNGRGTAGVASGADVKIMMLKKNADDASNSRLYVAMGAFSYVLRAKKAGVNIVATSNSWGRSDQESTIFNEIVDRLGEAGVLTFTAAGNATKNLDRTVDNPASNESDYGITVGCAGITGEPAGFSNYGKSQVDIFSPGMNILSTVGIETYFPSLYDGKKLSETTEYYGGFDKATEINDDGSVTPGTGAGGDDVSAFGPSVFCVQEDEEYDWDEDEEDDDEDDEDDDPDGGQESDASCELEIVPAHYFTMGENAASLKVTIKNAVLGEEYYLYFPYEKNKNTNGEKNTRFSIFYENGDNPDSAACDVCGGDVLEDEDGAVEMYEYGRPGYATSGVNRYMASHISTPADLGSNTEKLIPYNKLNGRKAGLGLKITPVQGIDGVKSWSDDEPHDVTIYLDHIAVSRPGVKLDLNSSYEMMSGTSMACPAAAGAGALVAALYPRQEGQSGADYAIMIKEKFLSCAHKTDALKNKCSTGGYIDLSLLESGQPVIRDAVCDLENETLTLKGSGLTQGSRLTYKRLYQKDAAETELPSNGMTVEYAADGSEAVIKNAKALFGTYTEFTCSNGETSGTGTFFLVKGQKKLEMLASYLEPNPDESDFNDRKQNDRYLISDADGKQLYAVERNNGTLSKFDGDQFVDVPGTRMKDAVNAMLAEEGFDQYEITGEFDITTDIDTKPIHYGNRLYATVYVTYEPGEDVEDEDDDEEGTERYYLASLDLSDEKPSWKFENYTEPEIDGVYDALYNYELIGDTLYAFAGSESYGASVLMSYDLSADAEKRKWKREQDLPAVIKSASYSSYKGKLYVFFGSKAAEAGKYGEEQLSDDVWCFDGTEWKKTGKLAFAGKFPEKYNSDPEYTRFPVEVKNGLVFVDTSVDGLGSTFLYDPETDKGTPMYYTINDSMSDDVVSNAASCTVTRDGVYYMRDHSDEMRRGWAVYRIPASDGSYQSPFPPEKKANTLKVTKKNVTVKYAKLKKKAQTVKAVTVKTPVGNVKCTKASGKAAFKVNKKNGKITIKKGLKKGTYTVKVKVTASGDELYEPAEKTVTVKIKVK